MFYDDDTTNIGFQRSRLVAPVIAAFELTARWILWSPRLVLLSGYPHRIYTACFHQSWPCGSTQPKCRIELVRTDLYVSCTRSRTAARALRKLGSREWQRATVRAGPVAAAATQIPRRRAARSPWERLSFYLILEECSLSSSWRHMYPVERMFQHSLPIFRQSPHRTCLTIYLPPCLISSPAATLPKFV